MYTLFLDTHDKNVVIVLYKDGNPLAIKSIESNNRHSVITLPSIKDTLESNNMDINAINEIIVVNGPGSFTGERIAVTIAKTIAYSLKINIKIIDSLLIQAISVSSNENKIVAIFDRNGAFVGYFSKDNESLQDYKYLNKNDYEDNLKNEKVYCDVEIDYVKVYQYLKNIDSENPHSIKPLYVKGISALND